MNPFSILFEDDEILLVNKPHGTAVQGGAGIAHPLDEELSKQTGYKVHLVHRLDKDTAGILIVAKNPQAAAKWTKLIATKQVKKEYTAICIGEPLVNGKKSDRGTIRGTVEAHGKTQDAFLDFNVEKKAQGLCLMHITLGTGRMHQIRIQLAKAGCPIAADDQHGDFKQNKVLKKQGIKKLQLAATKLTLPIEGKPQTFTIPLPPHMQSTVENFFSL